MSNLIHDVLRPYEKEGFVSCVIRKGEYTLIVYIQEGMPVCIALEALVDATNDTKDFYRP